MLSNRMLFLWITINLSDFQNSFVLIFICIRYELNDANIYAKTVAKMIATMNLVAVARFLKTTCHNIFKSFLATGSKDRELLSDSISTYVGTM